MTVFDARKGYVAALTGAKYDTDSASWSAGATATYLDSDGLHAEAPRSANPATPAATGETTGPR